jgi:hypothetical protein
MQYRALDVIFIGNGIDAFSTDRAAYQPFNTLPHMLTTEFHVRLPATNCIWQPDHVTSWPFGALDLENVDGYDAPPAWVSWSGGAPAREEIGTVGPLTAFFVAMSKTNQYKWQGYERRAAQLKTNEKREKAVDQDGKRNTFVLEKGSNVKVPTSANV